MDPELKKVLDALNGFADKNGVFVAIKDLPEYAGLKAALYQPAYNDGHGAATDTHKGAKTTLENRVQAAEAAQKKAEQELATFKATGDTAAIHAQYAKEIDGYKNQIRDINATHLTEKKAAKKKELRDAYEKSLEKLNVDPHKRAAMADAALSAGQFDVDDNLAGRVLQPGKTIPFAGDEQAQVAALAAQEFKAVPKELVNRKVPGGGPASDAIGGGGDDARTKFQRAKDRVKADYEKRTGPNGQAAVDPQETLNQRLGRVTLNQ